VPCAIPGGRQPPHRFGSVRLGSATPPPGGLCAPHSGVSDLTPGNYEEPWDLRVTQKTLTGKLKEAATGRAAKLKVTVVDSIDLVYFFKPNYLYRFIEDLRIKEMQGVSAF